jgi:hypothetical protein
VVQAQFTVAQLQRKELTLPFQQLAAQAAVTLLAAVVQARQVVRAEAIVEQVIRAAIHLQKETTPQPVLLVQAVEAEVQVRQEYQFQHLPVQQVARAQVQA